MSTYTDSLIAHDFPSFVRECHKICRGGKALNNDPYLLLAFAMAEDIASGRKPQAIVNLPPGTAKSFIFAVCLTAWMLAQDASASVMVVEHSKKLARDATRNIRRIMLSSQFQRNFKTRIDENWKGAGDFGTTKGGSVYATSITGTITGYRADLIIVDDPLSIKNANNLDQIDFVNETFDDEIISRMRDENSRVVVIMHRLNENDLTAHLIRKGGYKALVIPLIVKNDKTYTSRYGEWHRQKGEQLRTGRYSKNELRSLAFSPSFRYLYQQDKGGGASLRIKPKHFSYFDGRRNTSLPVVFSIDTAQKGGANSSRMVIQVWQTDRHNHYLLDVFSARCDYESLWTELNRLVRRYPPAMILIEDTSTGSALIAQAQARLKFNVKGVVPRGSKSERFLRHFRTISAGRIHLPVSADWAPDWVEEIVAFPDGEYDDHVDCLSMFLDHVPDQSMDVPQQATLRAVMVNSRGLNHHVYRDAGPSVRGIGGLATATGMQNRPDPERDGSRPRSPSAGESAPIAICGTPWGVVFRRPR